MNKIIILACVLIFNSMALSDQEFVMETSKKSFERADKNRDNIVTHDQFAKGFQQLFTAGLDFATIKKMTGVTFKKYDLDNDGLTWQEYLQMGLQQNKQAKNQQRMKKIDPPELDSV